MRKTQLGDTVRVHYTGKFENGEIFDSSQVEGREPLTATLSETPQLIKGFADGLYEMTEGQQKTLEINPEDAYGHVIDDLISEVPLEQLPEGVSVGDVLQAEGPMGPVIVRVNEVNESVAIIDANHPLAGKKLIFDIELVNIVE